MQGGRNDITPAANTVNTPIPDISIIAAVSRRSLSCDKFLAAKQEFLFEKFPGETAIYTGEYFVGVGDCVKKFRII